jgi:hypothetical protein|nr:MAG TPA_asm: hypothetical protein [Caudoviricetes sp.]
MRTTANIIVSTFTKFDRRCEYARGEHWIGCLVDEQLSLESGELVAHGRAHLCTGELPDDISYDFYQDLTVRVAYSKERAKWVASTSWSGEWLDEVGQPMSEEIKTEMVECYGLLGGEAQAVIDFDAEAQEMADNLEFVLYVNGLTASEKLAFVNGWAEAGGPVDALGHEEADCTPWVQNNTICVSAYELDFLPRTAEEWGRAYWLDNRARIINELAYWFKQASGIERSLWAKEHPQIAADVARRANGL